MGRMAVRTLIVLLAMLGFPQVWLGGLVGQPGVPGIVLAAGESLNVEGLPKDPKAYRAQVDQILKKVDSLIEKMKGNEKARPVVLDLMQTRDNVTREIFKVENKPDGSKWGAQEMRESVDAMLKLLKAQYEKATEMAS